MAIDSLYKYSCPEELFGEFSRKELFYESGCSFKLFVLRSFTQTTIPLEPSDRKPHDGNRHCDHNWGGCLPMEIATLAPGTSPNSKNGASRDVLQ